MQPQNLKPPGPRKHFWRLLRSFSKDPLTFLAEAHQTYGDISYFKLGPMKTFLICDPDAIESVLVKHHRCFTKDMVTMSISNFAGNGLLTSEGETWLRHRKMIAPPLHRKHVTTYAEAMTDIIIEHQRKLADEEVLDISLYMLAMTLDMVGTCLFGGDVKNETETIAEAIDVLMERFILDARTWRSLLPLWVPLPGRIRAKMATKSLDKVIYQLIESRMDKHQDRQDLLSLLLTARDDSGEKFSRQQVRDESITMLVAGHETTALALAYTCHLLARHPQVQAKLTEELESVLNGQIPTLQALPDLTYTDAVIKESMRLYPPAWLIGREALEDCTVSGYQVNKGEQVIMPQWVVHRDPRWYQEPLSFQPERWLEDLEQSIPRFAYFPFGGGPRICIGNHFSMMEMKLALAILFQHFTVSSCQERPLEVFPFITLRPQNGVYVRIKKRTASS